MNGKVHAAVVGLQRQVFQPKHFGPAGRIPANGFRLDRMAHHIAGQLADGGILYPAVRHHHAVPQDGVPFADFHHFPQLVGDKDHAHLLGFQGTKHIENALDLRVRQGGSGFVHDDEGRLHHQRAGDFDNLFVGGVQRGHHGPGRNIQPHFVKELLSLTDHFLMIQKAAFFLQFPANEHIFVNGKIVDQVQFLMDKGDPRFEGLMRRMELNGLAVQLDGSGVRLQHAAQNIHQGAFSGAVFAQQRADFSPFKGKINGFQHIVCAKGLHDSTHGKVHEFTSVLKFLIRTERAMASHGPFREKTDQYTVFSGSR